MAIDTATKRASVIQLKMPFRMTLPFPSGSVTSPDRYTLATAYAGTNFNPPPISTVSGRNYRMGGPGQNAMGGPGFGGKIGP